MVAGQRADFQKLQLIFNEINSFETEFLRQVIWETNSSQGYLFSDFFYE